MQPTRVTTSEFQKSFGTLSEQAQLGPIVITEQGRDSLVVMSASEWERLRYRDRRAGTTAALSEEWIEAIKTAEVPERYQHLNDELK